MKKIIKSQRSAEKKIFTKENYIEQLGVSSDNSTAFSILACLGSEHSHEC